MRMAPLASPPSLGLAGGCGMKKKVVKVWLATGREKGKEGKLFRQQTLQKHQDPLPE